MKYKPHEYQKYAIQFIETKPISAIFLDMGLGKTSITLSAIFNLLFDYFLVHKVLVIAPLRVGRDTWPTELSKWDHLSDLKCAVAIGSVEDRTKALKSKADIYIINRENVTWLVEESGIDFNFDMVVIDELSSFKNGKAKRFKSLMKVRPRVNRVVGLTGTPASNGLMDLWAEFRVLDFGKRLGRFITAYRQSYFTPDKRNGNVVFSYKPLPFAEGEIYKRIEDITISMKAKDFIPMPELVTSEFKVYLSRDERDTYNRLSSELVLSLPEGEVTAVNAAVLSSKLSQLANGAIYKDAGGVECFHDRKLDALEDIIEAANGKPLLVAYWFQHDLTRIVERMKRIKVNYSVIKSQESIRKWNKGEIQVGLIHPASAGHGLNLQDGGSTLVWFGLTWSLELYLQTIARIWRQGQSSSTVVIQHIVTDNTIDENILKSLLKKEKTQEALIRAVKANLTYDRSI